MSAVPREDKQEEASVGGWAEVGLEKGQGKEEVDQLARRAVARMCSWAAPVFHFPEKNQRDREKKREIRKERKRKTNK